MAREKNKSLNYTLQIIVFAIILTAPCDDILTWEIKGATFRIGFILIALAGVVLLCKAMREKSLELPIAVLPLAILLGVHLVLAVLNKPIFMTLGFTGWFALCAFLIVVFVNAFPTMEDKRKLLRVYLAASAFMCIVGVLQIVVAFFGGTLFADQFYNYLPRVDAFTTEPSYFATYLLPGWVLNWWLIEKKDRFVFEKNSLWVIFSLQSFGLIFSTSRMGIVFGVLWIIFRGVVCLIRNRQALKRVGLMVALCVVLMCASVLLTEYFRPFEVLVKLARGEADTGALSYARRATAGIVFGSVNPRLDGMLATLEAFRQSPFIGYSLGGVEEVVIHQMGLRQVGGLAAELLAAFGIFGFGVLVWFLISFTISLFKGMRRESGPAGMAFCGICWGLLWQIGVMQFSTNILRIYIWVNIGIAALLCGGGKKLNLNWGGKKESSKAIAGNMGTKL